MPLPVWGARRTVVTQRWRAERDASSAAQCVRHGRPSSGVVMRPAPSSRPHTIAMYLCIAYGKCECQFVPLQDMT